MGNYARGAAVWAIGILSEASARNAQERQTAREQCQRGFNLMAGSSLSDREDMLANLLLRAAEIVKEETQEELRRQERHNEELRQIIAELGS